MQTILSIIGTRPEAIKMAPVIRQLAAHPDRVRSVVCSTGQHREMLTPVLSLFGIVPDMDLALMRPDQTLAGLSAALLTTLDQVVCGVQPDWVLAQGDTSSVMAAALVAYYRHVRFGHVEAGLRTGDKRHPFPEEINRRIADLVADACFAPTVRARDTLLREGVPSGAILVTGNTVVDALHQVAALPFDPHSGPLADVPFDRPLVLVTAHRRESFGAPFRELCLALRDLAERWRDVLFLYPVHLNPNVRRPVHEILSGLPNLRLMEPLDYRALVFVMKHATLILTDSGGIQEEAPSFGVPVLVLRDKTERPEGVEAGVVVLVGTARERIVVETDRLLRNPAARARMTAGPNPYGDGHAADRIVRFLLSEAT